MDAEITLTIVIDDIGEMEDLREEDVCVEDLIRDRIDEEGLDYFITNLEGEYYIREINLIG